MVFLRTVPTLHRIFTGLTFHIVYMIVVKGTLFTAFPPLLPSASWYYKGCPTFLILPPSLLSFPLSSGIIRVAFPISQNLPNPPFFCSFFSLLYIFYNQLSLFSLFLIYLMGTYQDSKFLIVQLPEYSTTVSKNSKDCSSYTSIFTLICLYLVSMWSQLAQRPR